MGLHQWQCATMKERTIQYNTIPVKYNSITHITHNNIQHSRQHSICKIPKKQQYILYTINTQKRAEPKVYESY